MILAYNVIVNDMGAGILIINKDGKVLVLHRNAKVWQPNLWDITGGKILEYQKPIDVALAKTKQEIGLELKLNDLKFLNIFNLHTDGNNFIFHVWIKKYEDNTPDIILNYAGHDNYMWEDPKLLLRRTDLIEGLYTILNYYLKTVNKI